jgi:hypothetical protein
MSFRADRAGRAAIEALRGGPAAVFAAFERSCYVETPTGIACLGTGIGCGPLNVCLDAPRVPAVGETIRIDLESAAVWIPPARTGTFAPMPVEIPEGIRKPAEALLGWIAGGGEPDDALIGLGSGLTPAGDDFVGGAMIALRAFGEAARAERIAAWALPLARDRTNRISRAHLECAAAGEGHEALHALLASFDARDLAALSRIGHTSGLDAAAGALLALGATRRIANPLAH